MHVQNMSKDEILELCEEERFFVDGIISIRDFESLDSDDMKTALEPHTFNFLQLEFDDEEHRPLSIDEEQAADIIEFMCELRASSADEVFVHCNGGVSRSAAVAAFFNLWFNGDDSVFRDGEACPNAHVLHALSDAAGNPIPDRLIDAHLAVNEVVWRKCHADDLSA